MAVTSPVDYSNLNYVVGEVVLPGIFDEMYFISENDIAAWPTRDLSAPKGKSKYVGAFVLAELKKFKVLRATYDGGEYSWETQGTLPGKTFLNKLVIPYPKNNAEVDDTVAGMINDKVVVIFRDRQGQYRVLGAPGFPCEVKVTGTSGKGVASEGGNTIEITATDVTKCPYYEGVIDTDDGQVNAPGA